jgi:hypothetical protein
LSLRCFSKPHAPGLALAKIEARGIVRGVGGFLDVKSGKAKHVGLGTSIVEALSNFIQIVPP